MNKKRGFTLIELVVVIAVLGILVLLAAPKLLGHVEQAKITQIKNDIKAHEAQVQADLVKQDLNSDPNAPKEEMFLYEISPERHIGYKLDLHLIHSDIKVYDKRGVFRSEDKNKINEDFILNKMNEILKLDSIEEIDIDENWDLYSEEQSVIYSNYLYQLPEGYVNTSLDGIFLYDFLFEKVYYTERLQNVQVSG